MNVELIYDRNCPNVSGARSNLLRACAQADLPAKWREWESSNEATPAHARGWASPSILVNERDVAGGRPIEGLEACRLYRIG